MEIEVNWRRLFLIIGIIALAILAVVFIPRFPNRSPVQATEAVATGTPTSAPQKVVANVNITLDNQSQWKVDGLDECLPKLSAWIGEQYPLQSLTVIITDTVTSDMAVSAVFPDPRESWPPDVSVNGKCSEKDRGYLTCVVGVKKGAPGPTLDMLASVELAQLVADYYRPKTKKAWKEWSQNWKWENFQPLIHKENDQWVSNCLHLTH